MNEGASWAARADGQRERLIHQTHGRDEKTLMKIRYTIGGKTCAIGTTYQMRMLPGLSGPKRQHREGSNMHRNDCQHCS